MMLHPHHHPPSSLPLFNPSSSNFHAHFTFPSNVKKTFPNSTVSSSWTSSLTSSSSSSSFPWSPKPWLPTPFSFSYTLYTCQLKWNLIKHLFFFSTSTSNTNSNSTTQRSSPTNPVRRWGGVRFLLLLFVIGVHFLIHLFLDAWMTMMMTTTTTIPCSGRKGGGNRRDLRIPEGWRSSSSSLVEKRSPSWSLLASSNLQNSSPPSSLKWWVTSVVKEKRTLLPSSSTTTTTTSSSSSRTKNMNESSSSSSSWWWGWWWWWSQEGFTQDFYLTSPTVALTWLHHFTLTPFHLKLNLPLTHFLSEFFSLALVGYHTFFPLHAWIQDGLELWTPCSWTMDTCMGKWEDKEKNGTVFGMHWKKGGRMLFRCVVVPSFWLGGMHDVLWVLTYPYAHFDVLMTKTMRWFMYLSKRLSASFLGQSYNPLRHRWNMVIWNVDQVLVTTFFFTLVVCLYPTLMVYFLFFKWFTYSRQLVLLSLRHTLHGLHYVPFYTTFLDMSSASFKKEWIHPSLFTPATSSSFQSTVDLQLIQKNIHEPWTIQFRPLTLFERLRPSTW